MIEAKKYSILLVDDEEMNTETLSRILLPEYTVYTAYDGKSAIMAAEKHLPDLILLDIIMPEMDGYAVIKALKSSKKTRHIPVIFITALDSDIDEEEGLCLGAVDYISKPFYLGTVKLRVKHQIDMLMQFRTIERLSMTDLLTDLPNRRSFEIQLHSEWARAQRDKTPLSLLFIDADSFKNYNDSFGHQQGDVALQSLAKNLSEILKRPGDFAARWGGEEFVALLSNTDVQGAHAVAEQIRKNVEDMDILCTDKRASKITVSIGINTLEHGNNCTIDDFISNTDKALYSAKENGRNRVCHYPADI